MLQGSVGKVLDVCFPRIPFHKTEISNAQTCTEKCHSYSQPQPAIEPRCKGEIHLWNFRELRLVLVPMDHGTSLHMG